MPRSPRPPKATAPASDTPESAAPDPGVVAPTPAAAAALGSLSDLPVAGLTRRRIGFVIGALVAAWLVVLFARQVGEATEATARAEAMRASTAALQDEVAALENELALIRRQAYIEQAARQYRLGRATEIPFALDAAAPDLAADAPGSATVRLGSEPAPTSPLDSWSRLLFGDPPTLDSGG
jgi:cell division protein FtsB